MIDCGIEDFVARSIAFPRFVGYYGTEHVRDLLSLEFSNVNQLSMLVTPDQSKT